MSRHVILRGKGPDRVHQNQVAAGDVQHPNWVVRKGGALDQFREDGWDALPPLPCGREPVGRGLQVLDDGGRPHLPGLSEATGSVPKL